MGVPRFRTSLQIYITPPCELEWREILLVATMLYVDLTVWENCLIFVSKGEKSRMAELSYLGGVRSVKFTYDKQLPPHV